MAAKNELRFRGPDLSVLLGYYLYLFFPYSMDKFTYTDSCCYWNNIHSDNLYLWTSSY